VFIFIFTIVKYIEIGGSNIIYKRLKKYF